MTRSFMVGVVLALAACTTSTIDTPASSGVTLRVAVWDYTLDGMSEQTAVFLRGRDLWYPEVGSRLRRREYSSLPLGTIQTFMFDPLGNNQFEISVDIPITDALCRAGCNGDTLNFGIWEDRIEIWGPVERQIVERTQRLVQGDRNSSAGVAYEQLRLVPSK